MDYTDSAAEDLAGRQEEWPAEGVEVGIQMCAAVKWWKSEWRFLLEIVLSFQAY